MEMASWFEIKEGSDADDFGVTGVCFLTDDDIIAYHEMNGTNAKDIKWVDFVGHDGLMRVFNLPNKYSHREGFVNMPLVIRKAIHDGKMDNMFANADNLNEATPEFIPTMKRLANKYSRVADFLKVNPYRDAKADTVVSNLEQMKSAIKSGFSGSTIGELIRDPLCHEEPMLLCLQTATARELMDSHGDRHHYKDMINHPRVTRKVLAEIIKTEKHASVKAWANERLAHYKGVTKVKKEKGLDKLKVRTIIKGKAKIRIVV